MPAVSVIMPAYNVAPYIGAAIDSVLAQTFTDFELIVVDDGSKDGTADIVGEALREDPRIQLVQQANRGLAGARNSALRAARGDVLRAPRQRRPLGAGVPRGADGDPRRAARTSTSSRRTAGTLGGRGTASWRGRARTRVPLPISRRSSATSRRSSSCRSFRRRVYTTIGAFDEAHAQQRGLRLLAARRGRRVHVRPQRHAARPLPRPRRQPVGERRADAARHPARLHEAAPAASPTVRARWRSSTGRSSGSRPSCWPPRPGWRSSIADFERARAPRRAARPPRRRRARPRAAAGPLGAEACSANGRIKLRRADSTPTGAPATS